MNLPVVIIACQVFKGVIEKSVPAGLSPSITYLDYGLHMVPKKLNEAIQTELEKLSEPSLVVFGYGLCGNGLDGIRADVHTLLIPKIDDCIGIFLGSREKYLQDFFGNPGSYYLTKGWLEAGFNPNGDYMAAIEKYGEKTATWIFDQQYRHYKRLVFVGNGENDFNAYRPQVLEAARFFSQWDMDYEEIKGTEEYIEKLVDVAGDLSKIDDQFIVIHPGGCLKQEHFLA